LPEGAILCDVEIFGCETLLEMNLGPCSTYLAYILEKGITPSPRP